MSGSDTKHMIAAYEQLATVTPFLSTFFKAAPENFYTSESVEVDIERSEEDVAVVLTDMSTGARLNESELFTNKEFTAPAYIEAIALNSFDLLKRMPGQNSFRQPDVRADAIVRVMKKMRKIEQKIRRSIELQASQILQTGELSLTDSTGAVLYTLDYAPKAAHFPTAGVSWATATTAQKLADLETLADQIRQNSLGEPNILIMHSSVFENIVQDSGFQNRLDNRNFQLGSLKGVERGGGGKFRGPLSVGAYSFEVWTYNGRYKNPQTGVSTEFVEDGHVIMLDDMARLDATFGAIPNLGQEFGLAQQLLPELPNRFSMPEAGIDLYAHAWLTADGRSLNAEIGARPLLIPTQIDGFGCLDTQL